MNRLLVTLSLVLATMTAEAAEPWSVERCMEYAAEHSHTVRLQQYDLDAVSYTHLTLPTILLV